MERDFVSESGGVGCAAARVSGTRPSQTARRTGHPLSLSCKRSQKPGPTPPPPPTKKKKKDGAPTVLVLQAKSKAWATRPPAQMNNKRGFGGVCTILFLSFLLASSSGFVG